MKHPKIMIAAAIFAASTVLVQANEFGGSFGPAPTQQPTTEAAARDCGSDSFGGSFGLKNPLCPDDVAKPAPTEDPKPGDDCDDPLKGSFTAGCAEVAVRETSPQVQPPATDDTGGAAPSSDDDFGVPETVVQPPRTENPKPREAKNPPATRPTTRPQVAQVPARVTKFETEDFGVAPVRRYYTGPMHAPTPTRIPGAKLLTTQGLLQLAASGTKLLLLDVLGSQTTLPGALSVPVMARGRSLNDDVQAHVQQGLKQLTGGQVNTPVIVFCADPNCWLSYNGALRAVAAGYRQVYWYRGGHAAWRLAGGQFVQARR